MELKGVAPGGGSASLIMTIVPAGGGTDIVTEMGYELPGGFVGAIADRIFVERAIAVAKVAAPDKRNGFPTRAELKRRADPMELFDPAVAEVSGDWRIEMARAMERAAKATDQRIQAFEAVSAGDNVSEVHFCSSEGICDSYRATSIYLWAAPVASEGGQLQTSYWLDSKRFLSELEPADEVGRKAAERAVRMLGARKVKTQRVPVVLDPRMAASFVGGIASAVNGDMVHKKASFLHGRLGERIAPESITILDDGLLEHGLGTSPFDGEGMATRRTPVVEKGVLRSFLYDTFTARKARAATTGNASRGVAGPPVVGPKNFYLAAGSNAPEDITRTLKNGFYVTELIGFGVNIVNGDYSRGASGLWIDNGELAYPVVEVTIAGNLAEMLNHIQMIGSDLEFRGALAAPTLLVEGLTIAGA